jgi:hypothetical protein
MKKFAITLLLILFFSKTYAQSFQISGHIIDSSASPLPGAGISLLQPSDSSLINGASTDMDGNFIFSNLNAGKYLIKISFLGFDEYYISKEIVDRNINLGAIILKEKSATLGAVDINEKVAPVQTKGDTTQFNADAYKTNKDATAEDLATKMPGITTQDGKVQAQGEDVKKILIDGKPYMGDDPNAALKNLPAEIIDKIQVFDKKSDQSEFTGFFDGNTTKTMNIITRPQFRNGTFGRVYGGYGTEERYKAGTSVNLFKEKRKITLLGNMNNINEQNFSSDDLVGVLSSSGGNRSQGQRGNYTRGGGGSGGGNRFMPQNDASNFLVDQRNGITTTKSAGLNYINSWKKTDLTFSYFFNRSDNNTVSNIFRQYITEDSKGLTYQELNNASSVNENHRANARLEYKFDTLNSILFQPRISYQKNTSDGTIAGSNYLFSDPLSLAITNGNNNLNGISASVPLLYRHSFLKRGRTISANLTAGYNQNKGDGDLHSSVIYYTDTIPSDSTNQLSTQDTHSWNYSSEIVYTEPLDSNSQLSFSYRGSYTLSSSDKKTTSVYEFGEIDTALSNNFNSDYLSHSFGINYRVNYSNWNGMIGLSAQRADLNNERIFPDENNLKRQFNSILPIAMFQYRFSTRKNLRLFFRSFNNPPSVNQLQNVVNNNNPLQLTTGNPELTQDWQNFLNIRYSAANPEKNNSFFIFFSGNYTKDYIGTSTFIAVNDTAYNGISLTKGAQISRPVNLDGNYSLRTFANYSFPIGLIKSSLNLNANANYTRTPGELNDILTFSNSTNAGLGFAVSSNISDKFDFLVSSNANFNNVNTTSDPSNDNNSFLLSSRIKFQIMPWKGLVLQTDLNHQYNSGLTQNFNQNYFLWNAAIGYKFLKNQLAELRLSVFDLLKQNASVTRNTTDIYYEDVRTNVLQQYFMLTFTYNLKFFKSKVGNG